jgi:hypothetical protein
MWGYHKMDGLQCNILLKLLIWGVLYPHFRKPPYSKHEIDQTSCFLWFILTGYALEYMNCQSLYEEYEDTPVTVGLPCGNQTWLAAKSPIYI